MKRPASLSPRLLPRILAGLGAAAAVTLLTLQGLTWRVDAWIYDRLLAATPQPVDERIVLVVVDDASLAALGRWPWSRGVHADLVRRLDAAGVRGIAFDVMFAEPNRDDAAGDDALANAMRVSGKVVLPVMAEPSQPDGTLIEVLPMTPMIDASAALGHVEIDIDLDGVARSSYLYAGLGSAHWPSLALALRNQHAGTRRSASLPGLRQQQSAESPSPYLWNRDYRILVPYANRTGFQRASYIDVLRGEVPDALLRDRWILVGVTAGGNARDVLVPGRGREQPVPGLEYHANVLNALLLDRAILPLTPGQQLLPGILLALLPLLLYRARHPWRTAWMAAGIAAVSTLAASAGLLAAGRQWFAPTATLLVIGLGCLGWLLLRLRRSQRQASSDGLTRLSNRHVFDLGLERELAAARRSNRPLSLLLVDVDHFKGYNDAHGHQAGDEVLRRVAETLLSWARRPRDLAARYGGDELALVLPECSANAATTIAQAILDDVRALRIPHPESEVAPFVTLSIGVATYYPILEAHDVDLLKRADAALYRAKHEGRNRSHCSSGSDA
ncbi:MAG: diguanylate cyclase [Luteimonas sp.]|nr:diguanylate cyclase [Luteimonas sp.]